MNSVNILFETEAIQGSNNETAIVFLNNHQVDYLAITEHVSIDLVVANIATNRYTTVISTVRATPSHY